MTDCVLCALPIKQSQVVEEGRAFCCHGCRTVFNILSARSELDGFETHPLFREALRCGIISNSDLFEEGASHRSLKRLYLEISDLWCPSCAELIRLVLLRERGVTACAVDYCTDQAAVEYDPCELGADHLLDRIRSLGYTPLSQPDQTAQLSRPLLLRTGLAAFLTLNIMMLAYPIYASFWQAALPGFELLGLLSLLLALPLLFYCGWPLMRRAAGSLQIGHIGMEGLVSLGTLTAFALSTCEVLRGGGHLYFDSMGMVVTLVLVGKLVESRAKLSSRRLLQRLSRQLPRKGRRRGADGSYHFVPLKEVVPGDLLAVCSGEQIVLDGEVLEGEGTTDESLMTGEVRPRRKTPGDAVVGGSVLRSGWLLYRVSSSVERGALQRMIETIGVDLSQRLPLPRLADRIARWVVPCVLVLALGAGFCTGSAARALAVLLVSCPCAIGIAAPLTESLLIRCLARRGVLVRNRDCLSALSRITLCGFDKTGTVTHGKFELLSDLSRLSARQRSLLKSLAACSSHPVSVAIASQIDAPTVSLASVQEVPGRGLQARTLSGEILRLGSAAFLNIPSTSSETQCFFACDDAVITEITLGDRIREDFPTMPCRTALLSGDSAPCVSSVAAACHFASWQADLSPLEKREWILSAQESGERILYVGDGMNDAPALAVADVGVSVLRASDMSAQVSDLLLTTDSLAALSGLLPLARRSRRILCQNLFWAFSYNFIALPLAVFGYLHPLVAVSCMVLSGILVVVNALRVRPSPG